jgi:hypothetical protein
MDDKKIVTLISSRDKKPEEKKQERPAPNPELVQIAEAILERANSGELAAIAVSEVLWIDAGPGTRTDGSFLYVPGTRFAMMYGVEQLVYRIKEKSFS